MYKGVYTALITPFNGSGEVDKEILGNLVDMQIASGVDGLVPMGTTGESPTLNHSETLKVLEVVVRKAGGRVPVIAGTGCNDTAKAVALTREARSIGVDASLQVSPYYNRPTQEGLYRHFSTIAESVDLPMILYNIPGRSGVLIEISTLMRLAAIETIRGIKDATGNIPMIMEEINVLEGRIDILSGDDNLTFTIMALGGSGVVSVLSNLFPKAVKHLADLVLDGNLAEARSLHYELLPLFRMVFIETNPVPIKAAMAFRGLVEEIYRLPLCAPSEEHRKQIHGIVRNYLHTR